MRRTISGKSAAFALSMLKVAVCLILIPAFGCTKKNTPKETQNDLATLKQKVTEYRSLNAGVADQFGYVHSKCDGVGFTALCKIGGGCPMANIFASEDILTPGRWYRYPTHDCFPLESRSDDSNDHAIMRMLYFYVDNHRDVALRELSYLRSTGFELGRNDGSKEGKEATDFAYPVLLNQLAGRSTFITAINTTGYINHLFALYALLDAELAGHMDPTALLAIRGLVKSQPRNAIYQAILHKYTDGDQTAAIAVLLDESLFPAHRLPTSADRCEEYLFQRDDGSDWKPCSEGRVHSGTDLLFASWVIVGNL